jgi:RNA polymerase sigma-70 factor (ECF subfamily)
LIETGLRSLLVGGLGGDVVAYRAFLLALAAHLRSYLRKRLTRLPEDVEDLVQEVLLAVHNQRHTYDPALDLTPWVRAIARYKLVDLLRRRSRSDLLNDRLDEDDARLFTSMDQDAAEAGYDIARLLHQLPDRQRLPILHVKIGGESVSDTARRIGMSESAVKVGIHRGLKALAAKMRGAT